ncbi:MULTISPECIES: TetR/AcrR family transcriptional regulator [Virgibacillus]|uniref:DNA-binding transcriptional repressor AcrR n=2 Tax=Virgibacillus TaxID=84406 RepID=A0A024QDB1_9BACI|nr:MULTISPECIES: TetR/AcrR family transcriptional regulator [Virgibacillus]EQB35351.1 hypothetical protein M948_19820 [Virgibacillus sp. CM-4]MYL42623.1 TetR family transcriptional regulator [Virgibacillus massiliensis]GGJ75592.1 TetR family transcriptional regulator [Virgibacillus kapii]CDQ40508.1 DNA-binding transcriptional repressor AcrR [Virgibacillus massiliensis]
MNERKRQVLLTAQRLFIEKGFSATSVQDILEESTISKGTFYNYFSSKNECLIAILEHVNDETFIRRRELLIGQDPSDKQVLAEQIAVRMQVNKEQNLFMLFEAIFHSGDEELRDFVKKNHFKELFWLRNRIVDVYGHLATPFALDAGVLLLGMMQHINHIGSTSSQHLGSIQELIQYVIRRLDAIIPHLIETNDQLLGDESYTILTNNMDDTVYTSQEIAEQLEGFLSNLNRGQTERGKEYILFLLEELAKTSPRFSLIESISRSFMETFAGTSDESEAREIASKIWSYLDNH